MRTLTALFAGTVIFELGFRAVVLRMFPVPEASALPENVLKVQIPISYIESKS